ncbi:hypothetical protein Vretifemale_16776, partial [Volvox reticuliferus]
SGCAYAGCTSLAGANEVLQGRSLVCRCERVSYCSSTCQMLDWMGGHHQVCKMRPRKNESALPSRTATAVVAAADAAAAAASAAAVGSIGAAAAMSAARSSFGRRSLVTRR